LPDGKATGERCISALGFDWDNDGDYDLLLGTYEGGHLYRQMNEGSKTEPKFTGMNIPVMAGEVAFALPAKMTTPKLVDWDADGDLDIIAGTYSDPYNQEGEGGGIYLSLNQGKVGAPSFGALKALIAPEERGGSEPQRPDVGLYPDVMDYDGDGDLDLVAGGYSMWTPKGRELNAKEEARAAELTATLEKLHKESNAVWDKISAEIQKKTAKLDPESDEHEEMVDSIYDKYQSENEASREAISAAQEELQELIPQAQKRSFVWLYERI
jgi:gas vesicle protein